MVRRSHCPGLGLGLGLGPFLLRLLLLLLLTVLLPAPHVVHGQANDTATDTVVDAPDDEGQGQCLISPLPTDPSTHKPTYRVGVLAIRGFEAAEAEYGRTFTDYLTATAGLAFSPPVQFELKPLNFRLLFTDAAAQIVDFVFVNPSAYSCIESEYGAHSLVSQISRRVIGGNVYRLTKFGGVIAVRAESDIRTLRDIRGRVAACASISGLGSGQMQFREVERAGMSYINDPLQMVFTSNQGKVVNGVLRGDFDVGYVRTDQIERTKDSETGELVDPTRLRIINVQEGLNIDGEPFPFDSSTPLYPEWNVAALTQTPNDVSVEVQLAMLQLADHATVGFEILGCYVEQNCTGTGTGLDLYGSREQCELACQNRADLTADGRTCDTTVDLALLAADAQARGKYAGWRSTLSYMELRNMQEETAFIRKNATTGVMQCVRSSNIYDAIVCPEGHFRKSEAEVEAGCQISGLPCKELDDKYQCVCRPCVKAFDVDVFPVEELVEDGIDSVDSIVEEDEEDTDPSARRARARARARRLQQDNTMANTDDDGNTASSNNTVDGDGDAETALGCAKMDLCGTTQQNKLIRYRAIDNKKRSNLDLTVEIHAGQSETREVQATPVGRPEDYTYEFEVAEERVGVVIMELLANSEQIPESPLRLEIIERDCASDNDDPLSVATFYGTCTCRDNSVEMGMGGRCVSYSILLPAIIIPLVLVLLVALYFYVERKKSLADSVWAVKTKELQFDDPPEIIGRGTFGLVLLAEYRGTQVAVKRVIPPRVHNTAANSGKGGSGRGLRSGSREVRRNSLLGSGADPDEESRKMKRRASFDISADNMEKFESAKRRSSTVEDRDVFDEELANGAAAGTQSGGYHGSGVYHGSGAYHGSVASAPAIIGNQSIDGMSSGAYGGGGGDRNSSMVIPTAKSKPRKRSSLFSNNSSSAGEKNSNWWDRQFKYRDEYSKLKADFIVEMRYLSKLRHPCITTVMGAVIAKGEEPMLIMEYMDHGSLYDMLHNETFPLEGDLLLPILRDIAQGLRFLHAAEPQVIHGDLKAQNVLVDSKFRAKVADFGLSAKKTIGATGTPLWMAPELLRGESPNTAASDVYSFGVILYEVYSRKEPYEGEYVSEVLKYVADPQVNKRPPVPPACPGQVAYIMTDCLVGDPNGRPTFEEIDLRLKRLDVENVQPGEMHLSAQARKSLKASRGEDLLFKVFPKHIAEALRDGRKPEPENKDMVTIFFSDIVGFTDISATVSPAKVSDMLDRLYNKFDDLSDKHDVFKIETIGDAYLCVTNCVKDQESDHVKRIAEFSVDAIETASETLIDIDDPSRGYVKIRIGFHSGPVIASVVGSRLPKYSIFGDTVNTSSRMESNSLPGRIQCSDRSAQLLMKQSPEMPLLCRGKIKVKGKGEMVTYWVMEKEEEKEGGDEAALEPANGKAAAVEPTNSEAANEPAKPAMEKTSSLHAVPEDRSSSTLHDSSGFDAGIFNGSI